MEGLALGNPLYMKLFIEKSSINRGISHFNMSLPEGTTKMTGALKMDV